MRHHSIGFVRRARIEKVRRRWGLINYYRGVHQLCNHFSRLPSNKRCQAFLFVWMLYDEVRPMQSFSPVICVGVFIFTWSPIGSWWRPARTPSRSICHDVLGLPITGPIHQTNCLCLQNPRLSQVERTFRKFAPGRDFCIRGDFRVDGVFEIGIGEQILRLLPGKPF